MEDKKSSIKGTVKQVKSSHKDKTSTISGRVTTTKSNENKNK